MQAQSNVTNGRCFTMTKKDYELIAFCIHIKRMEHLGISLEQAKCVIEDFSDRLAEENPRFDRTKFLQACGIEVTA